jgi:hypothetical protein
VSLQFNCPSCHTLLSTAVKPGSLVTCGRCHVGVIVPQVSPPVALSVPPGSIVVDVPPLRDRKSQRSKTIPIDLHIVGVAAFILIIGGLIYFNLPTPEVAFERPKKLVQERVSVRTPKKDRNGGEPKAELPNNEKKPHIKSPPIALSYWNPEAPMLGFKIINQSTTPIRIAKVVYNGEFEARIGTLSISTLTFFANEHAKFPVSLTIGEKVDIFWKNFGSKFNYEKEIIFMDIYTDDGTYRLNKLGQVVE